MTKPQNKLPHSKYVLHQPERRQALIQEFYEEHHRNNRDITAAKDEEKKVAFFKKLLKNKPLLPDAQGIDLGCRGGIVTKQLGHFCQWSGVDLDRNAIALANKNGIPCFEMDISVAIDFQSHSFNAVMMTEVLEHLPYPTITVKEIHRILKPGGVFLGSVPLDYHLHRRWKVMRGGRLTGDPTHLHHFSFRELDTLLTQYFEYITYQPLRGTAARHPNWGLSYHHFVRDIAWVASHPRS